MPLTCDLLANAGCDTPNCNHDHSSLFVHPMCHPRAGLNAIYVKARKVLVLQCAQCEKVVTDFAIAAR
jgi:hypothetical protein